MISARYRLIAEVDIPAGHGLAQHVIERHFAQYVDYACARLTPGAAPAADGLYSFGPAPNACAAQEAASGKPPLPSPQPSMERVSDTCQRPDLIDPEDRS